MWSGLIFIINSQIVNLEEKSQIVNLEKMSDCQFRILTVENFDWMLQRENDENPELSKNI